MKKKKSTLHVLLIPQTLWLVSAADDVASQLGFPNVEAITPTDLEGATPALVTETKEQQRENAEKRQFDIADCAFDVGIATFFLMRASLDIFAASESCIEEGVENQELCAMDVSGVVASFADVGAFLAAVSDMCPIDENPEGICAAAIEKTISAVTELVAASSGIAAQCDPDDLAQVETDIEDGEAVERRLSSQKNKFVKYNERHAVLDAECTCDISSAILLLGYAGLEVTGATESCSNTEEEEEEKLCASEVSGAIASFGFVATYLSAAATECGATAIAQAACGADISKLVSTLAELASSSSLMSKACMPEALHASAAPEALRRLRPVKERSASATFPGADRVGAHEHDDGLQVVREERAIIVNVIAEGGRWTPENQARAHSLAKTHGFARGTIANPESRFKPHRFPEVATFLTNKTAAFLSKRQEQRSKLPLSEFDDEARLV
eukprot:TRINITY_DN17939_c0_g2_i1.p1 TRINITY_DN17939_c0_g2~~TRINITY_DN17939_c0_g2_i1.p1  ORF type:complete len:444 (+),score=77.54 TRINITY_DN17939_c0_g2_i1:82-1413(+)